MPASGKQPIEELIEEANALARVVADQVAALAREDHGSPRAIELVVLRGLTVSAEAARDLGVMLDSAQNARQPTQGIAQALEEVERKRTFFQSCTMRQSAALAGHEPQASASAAEAERLAGSAAAATAVDRLVEAYKATEELEARIAALRATARTGSGPEPRVLDLPRASVLVARRAIGAALRAIEEDE